MSWTGGQRYMVRPQADLKAEHALDVVVLALLVGLVLGLRWCAGEHLDSGTVGDVPPDPAAD